MLKVILVLVGWVFLFQHPVVDQPGISIRSIVGPYATESICLGMKTAFEKQYADEVKGLTISVGCFDVNLQGVSA